MNCFPYWISNFIVDYSKYLIIAIITYVLVLIFDVRAILDDTKHGMFVICLFVYGLSFIPFIYVFSFCFKKPAKGQVLIFILVFFTSLFFTITTFVLKLIESTRSAAKVIQFFFRIFPFYCFHAAILLMSNRNIFRLREGLLYEPSAFSFDVAMWELIFMIIIAIVSWLLLVLIENWYRFSRKVPNLNLKQIKEDIREEE